VNCATELHVLKITFTRLIGFIDILNHMGGKADAITAVVGSVIGVFDHSHAASAITQNDFQLNRQGCLGC
jgi:hypothetical protein